MDNLKKQICELIVKRLDLNNVNPEDIDYQVPLFLDYDTTGEGLGLDSVDALELVVGLKEEFGVSVTDEDMYIFENVNTIAEFIYNQKFNNL